MITEVISTHPTEKRICKEDYYTNKWFDTLHLHENLKTHSVRGSFYTIITQFLLFASSIGSNMILARLVAPEAFGLIAMVTAFTNLINIFSDLGMSAAIIQRKKINQDQVSFLFWLNILITTLIACLLIAATPLITNFYQEERLNSIIYTFAFIIFLSGLSIQHNALIKRQMKFELSTRIQFIASIVSILIGVIFAYLGTGIWAVLTMHTALPLISTILTWYYCNWRPNFKIRAERTASMIKFGAGLTGFDMINYFARNMDNILIGKILGPTDLGYYSKAYQLLMLPINQLRNPLNTVFLPALSTLQNDPEKYKEYFKKYVFSLAFFSMPIVAFLGVFSEQIVVLVLGPDWIEAATIFKILSISAFIQPVAGAQGLLLTSTGNVKRYLQSGIINSILITISFFIGIRWGIKGLAIGYSAMTYIALIPVLYNSFRGMPVSLKNFLIELSLPSIFSIVTGVVLLSIESQELFSSDFLECTFGLVVTAFIYSLLWQTNKFSKKKFKQVLEISKQLKKP